MNDKIKNNLCYEPNKIYIIGDRGVGKSSLIKRIKGEYSAEDTSGNNSLGIHSSQFIFDNCTITFKDLSDTPKWKYTKILSDEIEEVKAIIVVFALNSKKSFEHSKLLIDYLRKDISTSTNSPEIVLIGNKNELQGVGNLDRNDIDDLLTREDINNYLNSILNLNYIEISCKEGTNIRSILKFFNNLELEINREDEEYKKKKKQKLRRDNSCLIY
jgi:small GTP-binding protein